MAETAAGTGVFRSYSYQLYEMAHAALAPARAVSDAAHFVFRNPFNPLSATPFGKNIAAGAELFERMTRRYGKPAFGFDAHRRRRRRRTVREEIVWSRPFCNLIHFVRADLPSQRDAAQAADRRPDVGPLRDAAARNGRGVPADPSRLYHRLERCADGRRWRVGAFDLDDYIDYLREIFAFLGPGVHTLGVCQPSVPLIAAVALMEAGDHP